MPERRGDVVVHHPERGRGRTIGPAARDRLLDDHDTVGARLLGHPIEESLPKPNLEVMAKVSLPAAFLLTSAA